MTEATRHPRTGAPLLRYEVHERGTAMPGVPCGIAVAHEAAEGLLCHETPVVRLVARFRCGGRLETAVCREHLAGILEQIADAGADGPRIITPGMN